MVVGDVIHLRDGLHIDLLHARVHLKAHTGKNDRHDDDDAAETCADIFRQREKEYDDRQDNGHEDGLARVGQQDKKEHRHPRGNEYPGTIAIDMKSDIGAEEFDTAEEQTMLNGRDISVEIGPPRRMGKIPLGGREEGYPLGMEIKRCHEAEIERQGNKTSPDEGASGLAPIVSFVHAPDTYRNHEDEGQIPSHLPRPGGFVRRPETRDKFPTIP